MLEKVIHYEELSALVNKNFQSNKTLPKFIVIDVRNPGEIEKHGRIANSVNLPLKSLDATLKLSEDDFFTEVGIKKAKFAESLLVTHCRSGPRGFKAALILNQNGFSRFVKSDTKL